MLQFQIVAGSDLPYEERLQELSLPTLAFRRLRGDMIEAYKILSDKYYFSKERLFTFRDDSRTRGNQLKLFKTRSRLNVRKFSFTNRVVDHWNSLPDSVITAPTLGAFERRLDKLWANSELKYNYCAPIATGHKFQYNEELVSEAEDDGLLPEDDLW